MKVVILGSMSIAYVFWLCHIAHLCVYYTCKHGASCLSENQSQPACTRCCSVVMTVPYQHSDNAAAKLDRCETGQVRDWPGSGRPSSMTAGRSVFSDVMSTSHVRKCTFFSPDFAADHRHNLSNCFCANYMHVALWHSGTFEMGQNSPTMATKKMGSDIIHRQVQVLCSVCGGQALCMVAY